MQPFSVTQLSLAACRCCSHVLLAAWLVLPAMVAAQAGSAPPLQVDHEQALKGAGSLPANPTPMLPLGVLKLAETEQFLLWVDLVKGRLQVLERTPAGGMTLRQVIPVSIGKNGYGKELEGDRRTPVGVYRLTSFLDDDRLIDFYGLGAYTLNYPNVADRQHDRTGSGIWLHGLPKDVTSRPLLDSDGCVVVDNDTLVALDTVITTGITHIVLSDRPLKWVPAAEAKARRTGLAEAFDDWRQAWSARNNARYLSWYASDFSDFSRNRQQWVDYKSRVNNGKRWIEVEATQVSFYADPAQPELVTVRYYQDYRSSNYNWQGWKEQQWRETAEGWEIVYEGNG